MIARHFLWEQRFLAIGYFLLLLANVFAAVLYWPELRDSIPQIIHLIPFEPLQAFARAFDEQGFWAYFGVQHFWKGGGMFGVAAAGLIGSGIVARDADQRTAELLLSRPVTRARILAVRWCCGAVLLLVPFVVVGLIGGWLAPRAGEILPRAALLMGLAHTSLFLLATYSLTAWFSALFTHQLKAGLLVLGFLLLNLAIYMVKDLWDWSLYNLVALVLTLPMARGVYPWEQTFWLAGATVFFYVGALISFRRRDF